MLVRQQRKIRSGSTMLECAVVYPVTFFIILSMIIGAMGIFRYQEMAALAREMSRLASVRGAQYRKDAGLVTGSASNTAASAAPYDVGAAPYNVDPWNNMLWYEVTVTDAAGSHPDQWAYEAYDEGMRGQAVFLDPTLLKVFVGWTKVLNQTTKPDNFPGSRVAVTVKYPIFPEEFIWWSPDANNFSVSTAPMPITN